MKKIFPLFLFTIIFTLSFAQETYRDSLNIEIKASDSPIFFLKNKINNTKRKLHLAVAFNQLGLQYQYINQFDSALTCHHLALKHAINVGEINQEIGVSYNKIGIIHYYQGRADSAYYFIKKGVPFFEDPSAKANALNNLALMSKFRNEPDEAIRNYLQALKIYKITKDTVNQVTVLNNIGALHYTLSEDSIAETFHNRALSTALLLGSKELIIDSKVNLANIYFNKGQFDKAIEIHKEAISYYNSVNKIKLVIVNQNNMANVHSEKGDSERALKIYLNALALMEQHALRSSKEAVLLNIGSIYHDKKEYKTALDYYYRSLQFAKENEIVFRYVPIYEGLSSIYRDLNNIDSSLHYKNLHIALKDSLDNVEKEKKMMELREAHNNEELTSNLEETQVVLNETERKRILTSKGLLLAVSGLIVVAFAVFIFYRKNKNNKLLSESLKIANEKKDINISHLSTTIVEKEQTIKNIAVKKGNVKIPYPKNLDPLTIREKEVLEGVKDGLKDQEIADKLFISISTVRTHLRKAYVKIDVRNRAEAIQFISIHEI